MKVVLLGIMAAIYIGVVYFARFLLSLLVIVFCGFSIYEIIRTFTQRTASRRATA